MPQPDHKPSLSDSLQNLLPELERRKWNSLTSVASAWSLLQAAVLYLLLSFFTSPLGQEVVQHAGNAAVTLVVGLVALLLAWGLLSSSASTKDNNSAGCGCLGGLAVLYGLYWAAMEVMDTLMTGSMYLVLLAAAAGASWFIFNQTSQLATQAMGSVPKMLLATAVWGGLLLVLSGLIPTFPLPLVITLLIAMGAAALDYQYWGGPAYDQHGDLREKARLAQEEQRRQQQAAREAERQRQRAERRAEHERREAQAAEQRRVQEQQRRKAEQRQREQDHAKAEAQRALQVQRRERLNSLLGSLPAGSRYSFGQKGSLPYLEVTTPMGLLLHIWADEAGVSPNPSAKQLLVHFEKAVARTENMGGAYVLAQDKLAEQIDYWEQIERRSRNIQEPPAPPTEAERLEQQKAEEARLRGIEVEKEYQAQAQAVLTDWKVQTGLLMSRSGDIDLLLTTPDGQQTFAVDIKSHRGIPSLRDGVLHFGNSEKQKVQLQLHTQAAEALAQPVCWQPCAHYAWRKLDGILFVSGNAHQLRAALLGKRKRPVKQRSGIKLTKP